MRPSILTPRFRPGRQVALTWSIPDSFGGMTGALLHRSRAIVRLGGRPVDILTLDDRLDYADVVRELRTAGELIDGMRLVNIWDWLREHEARGGQNQPEPGHELLAAAGDVVEHRRDGVVLIRERLSAGSVIAADRFRADGSILVTDRRDEAAGTRRVVLYDRDGTPRRSWGSVWGVYRYWLDQILEREETFMIVDSKTAARFARTYRRSNVVTMHVLHGSHRTADGSSLSASRRSVLEHLSDFDSVVALTTRQRGDLIADLGSQQNLAVIPNGFDGAQASRGGDRSHLRGSGLMLSSLIKRKRVSHAIKAVARASATVEVSIDIYGEGERRPLLEKTIRSLGVAERVHLHGHDAAARSRFAAADFMLLTSTAEGLPLALVEGMAAGCIPIAYDIPYGPSDLIVDGRNGFLVAAGDIDALTRRIVDLQQMPAPAVEAMRKRAIATSERFDDKAVTRAWAREMEKAWERKHAVSDAESVLARSRHFAGRMKRRVRRVTGGYASLGEA
ncbi:glycosyltransferase [Microbacterium sp. A204]|uniref:glycosyltransferase n=1 Tax=Microbacterium sp. A204 TaxID=3457321 RepID=UPI003FD41283